MARFNVETRFVFSGVFKVEAENEKEAERLVTEQCGLVLGGNIHSSLPDDMVDWEFDMHPDKKIGSVTVDRND